MKKYNVLDQIQINYPQFSAKEKEIADYILENKGSILNINIKDLAVKTNSSTSTVTRFCKKIECSSFMEFKVMLNREIEGAKDHKNSFGKVESFYQQVVDSTVSLIDRDQVTTVVQMIKEAEKILVFGIGSSGLTALELKYRLMRMGLIVDAVIDPHMMLMGSSLAGEKDLVICISNSGNTEEIIKAAGIAKQNGGKIISITNHDHTPLTNLSEEVLFTSSTKILNDDQFINSQLSILYVLDVISLLLLEDEDLRAKRDKTLNVIHAMREEGQ
ncbi:MurR/RpiR family transcriptional regulator [Bacillus sp. V33-4]|uniref:MurR/RpiR family transcriptional regulator n=1 Tax=Bacillus sp. V33-4 TaxID=2054169 RepID=UPI000C78C1BB|nr:MurR/RpiR family transcriptional regulator [Bacillus sp. V33-4]PLR84362.1 MurR/RpiR family transcriptional regulator [Bacillus sp. V33-4]